MPKKTKRYVLKFNEKQPDGKLYRRNAFDGIPKNETFYLHGELPDSTISVEMDKCVGMCNLGVDSTGVHVKNVRFLRDGMKGGKVFDNAVKLISRIKSGAEYELRLMPWCELDAKNVPVRCDVVYLYFDLDL